MADILISDLTEIKLEGAGVFDALMRATKAHLEDEYLKNRIKGPEYAQVYLGSLDSVMKISMEFLLQKQKVSLEAQLMEQQVILATSEVQKANAQIRLMEEQVLVAKQDVLKSQAQVDLMRQQVINANAELAILTANKGKIEAEVTQLSAQTGVTNQQKTNLTLEALNIPKQGKVIDAQECKLKAEFDLTMGTVTKTATETTLLTQKVATEKAQIMTVGVDPDSVVGRQVALYAAQTKGFQRDAEQKAAKIMIDTWNARRMTDSDDTAASPANGLDDASIKQAVQALLSGLTK